MTLHQGRSNANERSMITRCMSCVCAAKCACFNPSKHMCREIMKEHNESERSTETGINCNGNVTATSEQSTETVWHKL